MDEQAGGRADAEGDLRFPSSRESQRSPPLSFRKEADCSAGATISCRKGAELPVCRDDLGPIFL